MEVVLFQYLGAGIGVASVAVLSFLPKYIIPSLYVHIVSCLCMGLYAYLTNQPGIYMSQITYLTLDIVAIVMWTKHQRNVNKVLDKVLPQEVICTV